MWEDRLGYDENIPEEIRDVFMWLCQDVLSLHRMCDFYKELFKDKEDLTLFTDYASSSFKIIEKALRTSMVMAVSRLNDPSTQFNNQNLSFQRLIAFCQDVPDINDLYKEFDTACVPFGAYRNKRFAHRDLQTTTNYSKNLLPGIGIIQVEEVLRLAFGMINAISMHYTDTGYFFQTPMPGGAKSLKHWFREGIKSKK